MDPCVGSRPTWRNLMLRSVPNHLVFVDGDHHVWGVCVCVAFPSKLQRYCWSWRLGRRLISATNVHLQDHEHYFCHGMYFTIMKSIWYKIEQTPHTVDIRACLLICVKCSLDHLIAIFRISRSSLRTSLCAPVLDRWLVIVVWLRVHKNRQFK